MGKRSRAKRGKGRVEYQALTRPEHYLHGTTTDGQSLMWPVGQVLEFAPLDERTAGYRLTEPEGTTTVWQTTVDDD